MLDNCYTEKKNIFITFLTVYCIALLISFFSGNFLTPIINTKFYGLNFFLKVLLNNLTVFFILCSGCILSKVITYFCIISNAYFLGANTILIFSLKLGALGIIVRGLFEYAGFFLAAIIGLKKIDEIIGNRKSTLKILILGITLIFLGALIETIVSPMLFMWFKTS